jgi:hypothetical protein
MNKNYQAYLLRFRRSQDSEHWRGTVENAHTGEVVHFADEKAVMRYLWQLVGSGRLQLETTTIPPPPFDSQNPSIPQ